MQHHHTGSRPHVQGCAQPLRVRHSARNLTDSGGLVLVSKLFDRLGLGGWIDCRTGKEKGFFRPSLIVEAWVVLLLCDGGVMDDLPLLDRRGSRRIFGWVRVPNPTTFGRRLRWAAERMVPLLDALLWPMVRRRWALAGGARKGLTLVVDSTVVVRYGKKQAGVEVGYNPKKRGRPSHHPLLAFIRDTGDCLGMRWRGRSAHTADGVAEWIEELVGRLRGAGVEDITVRLDKGFFSRRMVRTLEEVGVSFLLKVPRHPWLASHRDSWRFSAKGGAVSPGVDLWTASGKLWGARLLTVRTTRPLESDGAAVLDTYEVLSQADVLTNIGGIHALTAWRRYNVGAVAEQRIEELAQLSGRTAVDDVGGSAVLWGLAVVACQTLHTLRDNHLSGSWRMAQPKRLRLWLFRLTAHSRKTYLQLLRGEPVRRRLLAAMRALHHGILPPVPSSALRSRRTLRVATAILAPVSPPWVSALHLRSVFEYRNSHFPAPPPPLLPTGMPTRVVRPPFRHKTAKSGLRCRIRVEDVDEVGRRWSAGSGR